VDNLTELATLVQRGENTEAVLLASKLLEDSFKVEDIVGAVSKGLAILRNKCTVENFQLLDVLLASRAMVEVMDECVARQLQNDLDKIVEDQKIDTPGDKPTTTLVIGTIQGDVHDLGKHIVATLCRFNNFNVINLGKDVPVDTFINTAIKENADFVGVSSLMTVCLPKIKMVKSGLVKKGHKDIKVVGGGSAALQSDVDSLGLDYLAYDAFDGLDYFLNTQAPKTTGEA